MIYKFSAVLDEVATSMDALKGGRDDDSKGDVLDTILLSIKTSIEKKSTLEIESFEALASLLEDDPSVAGAHLIRLTPIGTYLQEKIKAPSLSPPQVAVCREGLKMLQVICKKPTDRSIRAFFEKLKSIKTTSSDETARHLSCTRLVQTLIASPFLRQQISSSLSSFLEQFRTIAGKFLESDHVESVLKVVLDSILCDAFSVPLINSEELSKLFRPPGYYVDLKIPDICDPESSSILPIMALSSTEFVMVYNRLEIRVTPLCKPGENYSLGFSEPVLATACADGVVYVLCGRTLYSVSKPVLGKPAIQQTITTIYFDRSAAPPVLANMFVIPSVPGSTRCPKLPIAHSLMIFISSMEDGTCSTKMAFVTPMGVDASFLMVGEAIHGSVTPDGREAWLILDNGRVNFLASKMLVGPDQVPRIFSLPKDEIPMAVACSRDGRSVCVLTASGTILLIPTINREVIRRKPKSPVGMSSHLVSVKNGFMLVDFGNRDRDLQVPNAFFLPSNSAETKIDPTPLAGGVSHICVSGDDSSRIGLYKKGGVEIRSYYFGYLLDRSQSWLSSPESFSTVDEAILNNLALSPHFFDALTSQTSLFATLMSFTPFQKAFLTHFPNIVSQLDPHSMDIYTKVLPEIIRTQSLEQKMALCLPTLMGTLCNEEGDVVTCSLLFVHTLMERFPAMWDSVAAWKNPDLAQLLLLPNTASLLAQPEVGRWLVILQDTPEFQATISQSIGSWINAWESLLVNQNTHVQKACLTLMRTVFCKPFLSSDDPRFSIVAEKNEDWIRLLLTICSRKTVSDDVLLLVAELLGFFKVFPPVSRTVATATTALLPNTNITSLRSKLSKLGFEV